MLGRNARERKALSLDAGGAARCRASPPRGSASATGAGSPKELAADIVVFDPAIVADRATFDAPFQYPAGINAVVVNGQIALRGGERRDTGRHAGTPSALRGAEDVRSDPMMKRGVREQEEDRRHHVLA